MKIERILIVADDSPPSINAIRYGFSLAKDAGAKVLLLSVIDPEAAAGNPDAGIFPDDALATVKSRADDFLQQVTNSYAQAVGTESLAIEGDVQSTVIKIIGDWKADFIIIGTHRRTGLGKWLLGKPCRIYHSSFTYPSLPGT